MLMLNIHTPNMNLQPLDIVNMRIMSIDESIYTKLYFFVC